MKRNRFLVALYKGDDLEAKFILNRDEARLLEWLDSQDLLAEFYHPRIIEDDGREWEEF